MSKEPLIVGIDPGNTSAVAALNLDGEVELLESSREFPHHEIIQLLIETGKPVVIAADTGNMPSTVEKIASSLGARRFKPDEDLDSRRKKQLGEGENSHEKDAMASARYAFNNLQRQIQKINRSSRENSRERSEIASEYFSKRSMRN
jgi:predicted RNase H-like nuclease (RuvC/YqgF family)